MEPLRQLNFDNSILSTTTILYYLPLISFGTSRSVFNLTADYSDAMTTSVPRRGPSPFHPGATTSQRKSSNVSFASPQPSRTKSRTENRRNTAESESNDTSGDKNTVALIRRVLCPDVSTYGSSAPRPLQEHLPPLTSSNDVDLQLYALIAVIIKEFVYSWYARITPDHVFVDEVLQLIAHCTRALEQRLRRVDVGQLVLDEVTGLVQGHITGTHSNPLSLSSF